MVTVAINTAQLSRSTYFVVHESSYSVVLAAKFDSAFVILKTIHGLGEVFSAVIDHRSSKTITQIIHTLTTTHWHCSED